MALLGNAVVVIWNGIIPGGHSNFIAWHNREHVPERLSIPGFLRGRRYVAERGTPEYLTLYEASSSEVLVGAPYLARLNAPTPWTKRSLADFRETSRGVCNVASSRGCGDGGYLCALRFDITAERAGETKTSILGCLDAAMNAEGVIGAHLCIADTAASGLQTEERKGRDVDVPSWIVLVEGSLATGLDEAQDAVLRAVAALGETEVKEGRYRLEFSLTADVIKGSATQGTLPTNLV